MKQNAIIIGDSYSTFEGYLPEGYAIFYFESDPSKSGVTKVEQTWWHQVCKEAGLNLLLNDSWSGSTISYTGYYHVDCSETSSFIFRWKQLIENEFFTRNEVHKVFVFGGTNDSVIDAPLGKMQFGNWTKADLYNVCPAICYLLHLIRETLPQADIYCLINTELKPEVTDCLKAASEKYGITSITFDHIDKMNGHPTPKGMVTIKNGVLQALKHQSTGE